MKKKKKKRKIRAILFNDLEIGMKRFTNLSNGKK